MQFNWFFAIFILIFGTIDNILICLILSQRKIRSNPCACLSAHGKRGYHDHLLFIDCIQILRNIVPFTSNRSFYAFESFFAHFLRML